MARGDASTVVCAPLFQPVARPGHGSSTVVTVQQTGPSLPGSALLRITGLLQGLPMQQVLQVLRMQPVLQVLRMLQVLQVLRMQHVLQVLRMLPVPSGWATQLFTEIGLIDLPLQGRAHSLLGETALHQEARLLVAFGRIARDAAELALPDLAGTRRFRVL
jgi:hypothetical protein